MALRYAQWMYDWEHRLTSVDNNRVVRPLEWGVEWARDWPCRNGFAPGHVAEGGERFLRDFNRRILAWNAVKSRSSALAKFPIPSWRRKFAAPTPISCALPRRCDLRFRKII